MNAIFWNYKYFCMVGGKTGMMEVETGKEENLLGRVLLIILRSPGFILYRQQGAIERISKGK